MLHFTKTHSYSDQTENLTKYRIKAGKLIDKVIQCTSEQLKRELEVREVSRLIELTVSLEYYYKKFLIQKEIINNLNNKIDELNNK